jgi:DNA uptake protein ComE-like DNA-binding protein
MTYWTKNEKLAAVILCILALLGAALRLKLAREPGRERSTFQPLSPDSPAVKIVEAQLEALSHPVNINSADEALLERLEGIGPGLAGRIVAERTRGGPFRDAADLAARVKGIGAITVQRLAGQLVFGDTTARE